MDRRQPSAEVVHQSPGEAINASLRRIGGWSGFARRLAMTMACGLGVFMPPVALYELSRVDEVRRWRIVEMELLGVEKQPAGPRRGAPIWVWSFKEPATGRVMEARDYESGDLPWSGPGWSTMEDKAKAWQRLSGSRWPSGSPTLYPSPGGKGTMIVTLLLCGIWWLALGISRRKRRQQG